MEIALFLAVGFRVFGLDELSLQLRLQCVASQMLGVGGLHAGA